ncbi:MAG: radical SAM protein [Candidatus Nanoarchaeia archaeon]|nr:radical SAM protein [Candidatus Nanoarchaeia archaeon]MDD5239249.1 radical SAM protein [Candidatus Nanoarchaeia archaeon]
MNNNNSISASAFPKAKGLLERTKSVCPKCMEEKKLNLIAAEIVKEDNNVFLIKTCKQHGEFKELLSEDAGWYSKLRDCAVEGDKSENAKPCSRSCPLDCGLCAAHKSVPLIVNIEVTNRCNLNCPYCYAHYGATSTLYEPTYEELTKMIDMLADYKPYKIPAVQFTGGEPTMRREIVALVAHAHERGIRQIQLATNGLRLAEDANLAKRLRKAGLKTIYLKFNGVSEKTNPENLKQMPQILGNCRAAGFDSIVLVPTIIRSFNNQEIGEIIRFGINNMDIIRGINFQPVSFSGNMTKGNLQKHRYTIDMLMRDIEKQTCEIYADYNVKASDILPATCVAPLSFLAEQLKGRQQPKFSMNPKCGSGTIIYVSKDGQKLYPFPQFIDVPNLMRSISSEAEYLKAHKGVLAKTLSYARLYSALNKSINNARKPAGFNINSLLLEILAKGSYESLKKIMLRTFYIGAMHFQDCYNFDINRLQSCVVGVATPDLRIIPFCAYNTLGYRKVIENKFSKVM